jgi:hypothetical protein
MVEWNNKEKGRDGCALFLCLFGCALGQIDSADMGRSALRPYIFVGTILWLGRGLVSGR